MVPSLGQVGDTQDRMRPCLSSESEAGSTKGTVKAMVEFGFS